MSIAQIVLMQKIKTYLMLHGREQTAENLSPGYCAGLTLLFLYLASTSRFDLFKQLLTYVAEWTPESEKEIANRIAKLKLSADWVAANAKLSKYLERFPEKYNLAYEAQLQDAIDSGELKIFEMHILKQAILPDDPTIEKLFALIEWLQRYWVYHDVSGYMGNLVVGMIRDNDMPHCFEKKLCDTSLIVNCKELVRIIENIPENCPVFMGKFDHAFALFKSGEFYYLYDSNDEMLLDPTESAEIITEILAKDIYKDSVFNQEYPLYMLITSTQDQDEKIIAALDATIDEITQTKPLNQSSLDGCTAILLAVKNAQDKVVTARVARGEDVNIPHRTGLYPIHLAKEISVINELIKAGAKIDQPIKTTVEVLGQLDIDTILCYRSLEGATPLYVLAGNGEPKVLEWLIQQHADINAASAIGLTPLMNAAKSGKLSNVTFLLQHGADVSLTVSPFKGPATIPGTGHHLPILQVYAGGITSNLYEGYNAAMMAAANNHTEVAIELIDGKTNILQRGYDLHSLLTIAAKNGNARLVKKLIECKASLDDFVEMPIGGNATALYLACRGGHLECAELLINAGAGIQPASLDEIPTIFGACVSNNPEILQLLQQHGADIETSFNGITPFGLSITKNCQAAAEYLIKAGATLTFDQVDAKTILEKDNASMLTLVMQHINLTDKQQRAILKIAIEQSSVQCVKLLLKNHSLLSNFAKACKFIQDSLERLKNDPCLTAELIAHCLLVQKHAINFQVIAERIFCMGINNSLVFDYFKLASEGKPLNEILNHLISEIPFKELNTKRIISEAVHKADSVENLMAILLLREKELDSSDENSVELLFKVIKEVIFEYPPEMILRGLTASPNYSRNK